MQRGFRQVDVFTEEAFGGNPVAVVLDGDGLDDATLQRIAHWTNLSETTFVLPPSQPGADYRVRIFTPGRELPFAGHPTLGTCHAWLEAGGVAAAADVIVQECAAGLIPVRRTPDGLAFTAPPLIRDGPVDAELVTELAATVGLDVASVLDAAWIDNGPGWVGLLLDSVDTVLGARAGAMSDQDIGLVATYPTGSPQAIEVRALFPKDGCLAEDPVTGSLNASLAQWLLSSGRLTAPYVARQGTALGRSGRVHVDQDDDGTIWIGGGTITLIEGRIEL